MPTQIRLRRDTLANWTAENPVLEDGEIAVEYNVFPSPTEVKFKAGDGVTAYTSLPYTKGDPGSPADNSITNAKLADLAANRFKGAVSAGDPADLTPAQARTVISSDSGGGTTNFLRADGTWSAPPSGGTPADDSITNAKLSNVSTSTIKGRVTASTGDPEDLTPTQARTVITSDSGGGTTNFLRADGTFAAPSVGTPADNSVTNAKLADLVANRIKGAVSAGDPVDLTPAQARTVISSDSGGGTTNYFRADGTWAAPAGGGAAAGIDNPIGYTNRFDPVDAFGPIPEWDLPVVTSTPDFQEYNVTTISGGVLHDVTRVGAAGTDLDITGDPKFRYLGIPDDLVVPGIASYANHFVQLPIKPGGASQFARWFWNIEWETNASEIEIRCKGTDVGTQFAVKVNDRWYSETLVANTHSTNNRYVVKLVFPDARWRRIEYRMSGDIGFGGIWTNATATVRKPLRVPNRKFAFIGDSITNGSNIAPAGGRGNLETSAPRLAHILDIDEPVFLGVGATSWTAGGTGGVFIDQIATALDMGCNGLVILGSSNNAGTASGTISTAVTTALATIPSTITEVYVVGSHLIGSTHAALNSTIRLAVEAAGRTYIDYGILDPADAVDVSSGDNVHPTFEGHKKLTQRLADEFAGERYIANFTLARSGNVPAPITTSGRFLKDDGTWDTASGGTVADNSITNAKLADLAANRFKGAVSAGDPVDLTPAQARTVISSDSGGGTTNYLRADGSWAAPAGSAPADDSITNAKLSNVSTATIKGRVTAATGDPEDLTPAQARTVISSDSGGGTTNVLRADGTWGALTLPTSVALDLFQTSGGTWPARTTVTSDSTRRVNYITYFGNTTEPTDFVAAKDSLTYRSA